MGGASLRLPPLSGLPVLDLFSEPSTPSTWWRAAARVGKQPELAAAVEGLAPPGEDAEEQLGAVGGGLSMAVSGWL